MKDKKQTILIVAAHPDDEALGCGGTIAKYSASGNDVYALFLTDGVGSRTMDKSYAKERNEALANSSRVLGIKEYKCLDFPDNEMDSNSLLQIVKPLESYIAKINPDIIITHHKFDLNIDHQICHNAVITACRPQPGFQVNKILAFEVPSSTEWQTPSPLTAFIPNYYVNISEYINIKAESLKAYNMEMREYPHSRSYKAVEALGRVRGSNVGVEHAEGFMLIRYIDN